MNSRFSPDTWIDALNLPFAMVQMGSNRYVEVMAPDARPGALVIATLALAPVLAWQVWRARGQGGASPPSGASGAGLNRRAAWALLAATWTALVLWIVSSANGRYGLVAQILAPVALLSVLLLLRAGGRVLLGVLGLLLVVQFLFLKDSYPQSGWEIMTPEPWRDADTVRYPPSIVAPWRDLSKTHSVAVVSIYRQTGMSLLYDIFGPRARYTSLNDAYQTPQGSPEWTQISELLKKSDLIFAARPMPVGFSEKNAKPKADDDLPPYAARPLRAFGFKVNSMEDCHVFPVRMGMELQICPMIKTTPIPENPEHSPDADAEEIYHNLQKKCPSIFGSNWKLYPVGIAGEGRMGTVLGDGKYRLTIDRDRNVSVQHRSAPFFRQRQILTGEQARHLDRYTCAQIIGAGKEYWGGGD